MGGEAGERASAIDVAAHIASIIARDLPAQSRAPSMKD